MYARIATTASQPDRLDDAMGRIREQTVPLLQDQKGFRGAYWLLDRETGKAVAISLWETHEDERASIAAIARSRNQALQQAGVPDTTTVEVFEVALQI